MSQIGFPFPIPRIVSILEEAEQEQAKSEGFPVQDSAANDTSKWCPYTNTATRLSTPKGFMVWQQISINRINSKCYGLFVPSKILILWQVR